MRNNIEKPDQFDDRNEYFNIKNHYYDDLENKLFDDTEDKGFTYDATPNSYPAGYSYENEINDINKLYTNQNENIIHTSNSINPASTFQFILNMGYPPPPIFQEPLRRLAESLTEGSTEILNVTKTKMFIEEIEESLFRLGPVALFVIQQRLHSSRPIRVSLAIQLLDEMTKRFGLPFLKQINKELMRSLAGVIKAFSFKERTISGQLSKIGKFLSGSKSNVGISTDPKIYNVRIQAKKLLKGWYENYRTNHNEIKPIVECYNTLVLKGIDFNNLNFVNLSHNISKDFISSNEINQRLKNTVNNESKNIKSTVIDKTHVTDVKLRPIVHVSINNPKTPLVGLTEHEFNELERLAELLMNASNDECKENALLLSKSLERMMNKASEDLKTVIRDSPPTQLDSREVRQLNLITLIKNETIKLSKKQNNKKLNLLDDFL